MKNTAKETSLLIERWKAGSEAAFNELFNRYFNRVYQYALSLVKENAIAEEIVMDVMLCIWQHEQKIDQTLSFDSYIFKITKNKILDHFRKKTIKQEGLNNHESLRSIATSDDQILTNELSTIYDTVINKLPEQKKKIFIMSREDGLTYSEIAIRLNLSVKTIENHMTVALDMVRKNLKAYEIICLTTAMLLPTF